MIGVEHVKIVRLCFLRDANQGLVDRCTHCPVTMVPEYLQSIQVRKIVEHSHGKLFHCRVKASELFPGDGEQNNRHAMN